MSASRKLKWRKLVNQLRFMYEELEIADEVSTAMAAEFQEYYEVFCAKNNIDIGELNRHHAERIAELYGSSVAPSGNTPYTGSAHMVLYQGEEEEHSPAGEEGVAEVVTETDHREMHEIFSKLFKKLALHLHPDKLTTQDLREEEKKELEKMFTKAKQALEEKRYFILLNYAEQLKISLPKNFKQQIRWMKKEVEMVRKMTAQSTRSYNYVFAECETDEDKDKVMRQFIQQLFHVTL